MLAGYFVPFIVTVSVLTLVVWLALFESNVTSPRNNMSKVHEAFEVCPYWLLCCLRFSTH